MSTSTDRSNATRRADHLLDDILNVTGRVREHIRPALVQLIHSDLAGGSVEGASLRATSYDRTSSGRRTEHYVDEAGGSRQLTAEELAAGTVPDWSVTVDPDPVGDTVGRQQRDQVHEMRTRAEQYLRDAANALHAAQNTLAAFMQLRDDDPNPTPVRYCGCAKHREKNRPPVQRSATTVGDRLAEPADLCGDCYEAVRRTAESGSKRGRLPSEVEVRHHDRHGRWPYGLQRAQGAA